MNLLPEHVQQAFSIIRKDGISPNNPSTKWDIIDPETSERFPPKAVLRIAKELAGDTSSSKGGGWPTNDPLQALGFEIVLKVNQEESEVAADVAAVIGSNTDETTKQRLVNARLGQGSFREALIEIWSGKCAINECDIKPVLRASHIKAWRASDNVERLDPDNGILLSATVDALFDVHLITFMETGRIKVSSSISTAALSRLGLSETHSLAIRPRMQKYLQWHRAEFDRLSGGNSYEL
jgi:hypothetical protein